jgi:outer membrane protein
MGADMNTLKTIARIVLGLLVLASPLASAQPANQQIFLSLDEAIVMALQNNLDIQMKQFDPESRREEIRKAEAAFDATIKASSAQVFTQEPEPQRSPETVTSLESSLSKRFSSGGNVQATLKTSRSGLPDSSAADAQYDTSLTVSAGQALLKGRGAEINRLPIVIAQKQRDISVSELRAKIIEVVARVKTTYWRLIYVRGDLEAKRLALQLAYDLVRINEAQVNVGTLAPIEVLQAQATAASREVEIISAEQTVREVEDQLKLLLNIADDDPAWEAVIMPTDAPLSTRQTVSLDESLRLALQNSESLKQLRKALELQQLSVMSAEHQLLPELGVQGSVQMSGSDDEFGGAFSEFVGFDRFAVTLAASFSYPIGNAAAQSSLKTAQLSLDKARLSILTVEQTIMNQVKQAVLAVETAYRLTEASQLALQLAQQQLDAEQKKFNEGLSTNFQVLQYQGSLATARSRYTSALTSYNQALAGLEQITGTTLHNHGIVVND